MDTRQWMQKYLAPKEGSIFMPLLGVAAMAMGIVTLLNAEGDILFLAMGVIFTAGGPYLAYEFLKGRFITKNWLKMMEREGNLATALNDFRDASDYLGGELRLGRYWCFGKGSGIPTPYRDIVRAYQHIHKTNFAEDSRSLMIVTTSGSVKRFCKLPLGGTGDQELNRALTVMLSQNPNIQIGYKR